MIWIIRISILVVIFVVIFFLYYIVSKGENTNKCLTILLLVILGSLIALPMNYKGIVQEKFNKFVDKTSNYINTLLYHNNKDILESETMPTIPPTPTIFPTVTTNPTTAPATTPTITISTPTPTPTPIPSFSNLIGMKETDAVNICVQNDYNYSVEYYLGGDGTVISQSPKTNKKIKKGGKIKINVGISKNKFSKKLLKLINKKRTAKGLKKLKFSKKLNAACKILAKENVNSTDCTRPDGSHWSTIIYEKKIFLYSATFTTRDSITSLSDANKRVKYTGNNYGSGNLLTPSYNIIGMAYSSKNMLVIIIGNDNKRRY